MNEHSVGEREPHDVNTSSISAVPFLQRAMPDENDLIERLRRADRASIAQVYRTYGAKVRAYAARMLGDHDAAEDVVHDVFVQLPQAIGRFRMESRLDTFLISIAVNLCRHRIRSRVRARRAADTLERRHIEPDSVTPDRATEERRLADALRQGLETLSVEHREVFVLAAIEEHTSTEVGAILGIPEGTARTRLFHARKQLRSFLEREGAM